MKTLVRGLLAVLVLLLVVGCSDSSDEKPDDPTAAVQVEVGKAFTWNGFSVAEGWALKSRMEKISMEDVELTGVTGDVANDADEARFAVFEFVFVTDGQLRATIRCTSDEIPVGESRPMECPGFGGSVPESYDLIQVQEITR